jgi:hypothetical protein
MRQVSFAVLIIVVFGILPSSTVSADAVGGKEHLHTAGRVLPAHHVVINEQNEILEIISNTTEDVNPRIYLNKISKERELPANPKVLEQYRRLVPSGTSNVGVLYRKSILEPSLRISDEIVMLLNQTKASQNIIASSVKP